MSKTKTIIDITDIIPWGLMSRESARRVKAMIDELVARTRADLVEVDFEKVGFSSRCFMDEFYNLFLSPAAREKNGFRVETVNMPENIGLILAAVIRSNTTSSTYGLTENAER